MSAEKFKVIIVGAGISGLAAGKKLREEHGVEDFVVLEAQDRLGGRVWTRTTPKGHQADFGASWLGKTQTRMYELCREYGIELVEQYERGRHLIALPKEKQLWYTGFIPPLGLGALLNYQIQLWILEWKAWSIDLENPSRSARAKEYDAISLQAYIDARLSKPSSDLCLRAFEIVFGVKCDRISLLHALQYIRAGQGVESLFKVTQTHESTAIPE